MQRTSLPLLRVDSSPRAARKSEWLRSALVHHYSPDGTTAGGGAENEIVVLATGIDQYLQEVFHHLAFPNREDTVSAEDFRALCALLGLHGGTGSRHGRRKRGGEDEDEEEFWDACSQLPAQLAFKDFHARLCGYFRVRSTAAGRGVAAAGGCGWRVPLTEDTELVERHIRLRWPRARRRKCVSFDLPSDQSGGSRRAGERDTDEVWALRELVEDLRSALQGSDARCLALEVALGRERSRTLPPPPTAAFSPASSITFVQGKLVPTHRIKGAGGGGGGGARKRPARTLQDIRDPLLRELKLIRSSRDGQLEEAIKFNERLEKELQWAYQEVRKLQGVESALRKENAHIRRRAEEARAALSLGLQRVRILQEQAHTVPQLQTRISQLEAELQQYRSCCICLTDSSHQQGGPIRAEDTSARTDAGCLQRAVEGRAASDEEEEENGGGRTREEGQHCLKVAKTSNRVHGCGNGCWNHSGPQKSQNLVSASKESAGSSCRREENKKCGEDDDEDKMKLEEKLTDALTLLLQLRNKNMSRRAVGQIVMDALDVCSRTGEGRSRVVQVADALCLHLSSNDLHGDGGNNKGVGGGQESRQSPLVTAPGCQTSNTTPLLISC